MNFENQPLLPISELMPQRVVNTNVPIQSRIAPHQSDEHAHIQSNPQGYMQSRQQMPQHLNPCAASNYQQQAPVPVPQQAPVPVPQPEPPRVPKQTPPPIPTQTPPPVPTQTHQSPLPKEPLPVKDSTEKKRICTLIDLEIKKIIETQEKNKEEIQKRQQELKTLLDNNFVLMGAIASIKKIRASV
jgi:hypothetical protein